MKPSICLAIFFVLTLAGCSGDEDGGGKSAVDRRNERVAQEAMQAIKTPLDQARAAAEQENSRNKKMEDQLKMQ